MTALLHRFLARQFARPSGLVGQWVITPLLNRIGRNLNRMALELLEPQPGEALLDVGIGGAALLKRLVETRPKRLVGVDVSAAAVARANRRYGPRAEIVQASAEALPFADASFDGITSVSVLHFWPDLGPPLRELARVLRPGGRLVLVFEPPEALRQWRGHRYGFELWDVEQVIAAAERAGLHLQAHREGRGVKPDFFVGLRFRKGAA